MSVRIVPSDQVDFEALWKCPRCGEEMFGVSEQFVKEHNLRVPVCASCSDGPDRLCEMEQRL